MNYIDFKLKPNYNSNYNDKVINIIENSKKLENSNSKKLENSNSKKLENSNSKKLENSNSTKLENSNSTKLENSNSTKLENSNSTNIKREQIYNFVYHYLKKIKLVKMIEEFEVENESDNEYLCIDDYFIE